MARPAQLSIARTGKISAAEKKRRQAAEAAYKGTIPIREEPPETLTDEGKDIYRAILRCLPLESLNETDGYTVEVVADAIAMMRECRRYIRDNGLFVEYAINKAGDTVRDQNKAVRVYQTYSEILKKFTSELGLSPSARSRIANMAQEEKKPTKTLWDILQEDDEEDLL